MIKIANKTYLFLLCTVLLMVPISHAANQHNRGMINQAPLTIAQCDTNGDNQVSILDVVAIISKVLQGGDVTTGTDCNEDGSVSILDVVAVINMVLQPPKSEPTSILNDTGITFGGEYSSGSNETCTGITINAQDCSHGRDVTHNDNSDGHAGFSFTKLDSTGNLLSVSATNWSCVKDNVTGLIWEVKTNDGGLRDKDWRYTWYNSTDINDGGSAGITNGGSCVDNNNCDTEKFVQQVNSQDLCGNNDWRLPTIKELENIVNFNHTSPAIDTDYFPNTNSSYFWSASPHAHGLDSAWYVYFSYGYSSGYSKTYSTEVRLVRTGQ